MKKQKLEIINQIKKVADTYFKDYTQEYNLNIYYLKKGLEEYCGILL